MRAKGRAAASEGPSGAPPSGPGAAASPGDGSKFVYVATAMISLISFVVFDYVNNPKKAFVAGTPLEAPFKSITTWWRREAEEPYAEKLIPDYPNDPYYANDDSPPGTPARHLLVLDVEKTIFGLEHDARYGWRYFKRPGLNEFIRQLAPYFEIVLFYESDNSAEAVMALQEELQFPAFLLGPSSAQQEFDGTIVKRLDLMNRDMGRIILIDDDRNSSKMFPRNTLHVAPYEDKSATDDTTLLDLIPMLQSLVHYGAQDVRDVFDGFGSHDAADAATEYRRRVYQAKQTNKEKRNRGLGKFIRSALPDEETLRSKRGQSDVLELMEREDATVKNTSVFSKKEESIGAPGDKKAKKGPVGKKRTGALFTWVQEQEAQKAELEMRKQERFQQIMAKKQKEAAEAELERSRQADA